MRAGTSAVSRMAVTGLLCVALGACAGADPTLTPAEQGERLYQTYCSACHGPEGAGGGAGPSLLEPRYADMDDDAYRLAILRGVEASGDEWDGMSAIPALDDREIELVIAHVRTLQGNSG